ncbi:MAG: hypothetical protein R8K22_07565 [Mariprofundaceae bacterium]
MRHFSILLITLFMLSGCAQVTKFYDDVKDKLFSDNKQSEKQTAKQRTADPLEKLEPPAFNLTDETGGTPHFRSLEEIAKDKRKNITSQEVAPPANTSPKIETNIGKLVCRDRHAFVDQGKVKDMRGELAQIHITSIYLKDNPTTIFANSKKNIIWDNWSNWQECSAKN